MTANNVTSSVEAPPNFQTVPAQRPPLWKLALKVLVVGLAVISAVPALVSNQNLNPIGRAQPYGIGEQEGGTIQSAWMNANQMSEPNHRWLHNNVPGKEKPTMEIQSAKVAASALADALIPVKPDLKETSPKPTASFEESQKQCFSIEELERQLRKEMESAKKDLFGESSDAHKYGNKHANLIKMEAVDRKLDIRSLEIPIPHGIESDLIRRFLAERAPSVFTLWEALKHLNPKDLSKNPAAEYLQQIDRVIKETFSAPEAFERLSLPETMQSWLDACKKGGDFLMVRSTGAEDSHQTANAGGNVSRAYIPAEKGPFMEAVGDVVRSYFSKGSLQNRLNSGANPFAEELKLAVTAQQLIGEPVGGEKHPPSIPVSFVLFTNEPLYVGNEKFRAMRISMTYGHGEGVVGNHPGVATDTALILRSESDPSQIYILKDTQYKRERLAPLQDKDQVILGKTPNLKHLAEKPCLDNRQLAEIYHSGVLMESFFEHPTDIEGIVKNRKIYFVQARPVNRKPLLPTYLKEKKGAVQTVQATPLVPGKASVVSITQRDNILCAPTLKEAEEQFRNHHQLVIVEKEEPQNSHPVVNFSSLGIPCLIHRDKGAIDALKGQVDEKHPLAVCMQTATLNLWDSSISPLEEQIQEGFAVHPAQVAVSLDVENIGNLAPQKIPEEIKELLYQIRDAKEPKAALAALENLSKHRLFTNLKEKIAQIEGSGAKTKQLNELIHVLKTLQAQSEHVLNEVKAHFKQGNPAERLQKLLQLKILESLIGGPAKMGSIGQYSLLDADLLSEEAFELIDYQKSFPHPARCGKELLAGKRVVGSEAYQSWKIFLTEIEKGVENKSILKGDLSELRKIVSSFEETGSLAHWLTFFPKGEAPLKVFQKIKTEMNRENKLALNELLQKKNSLEAIRGNLDLFASPATYKAVWEELSEEIKPFYSASWLQSLSSKSPAVRAASFKVMEIAVDLLDLSLKTVKASGSFKETQKRILFKEMLAPYLQIMKSWAIELVPKEALFNHPGWPLERYLGQVETLYRSMSVASQNALRPTPGFSVSGAVLTAGTSFDRHYPETLEDMLTLLHQNCLSWTSILNKELLNPQMIAQSHLPTELKKSMQIIEGGNWGVTIQRIGIEVGSKQIAIHYNVPLRNHSGHVDLIYDLPSKKISFQGQLLGQARERWGETVGWLSFLEKAKIFSSDQPTYQGPLELRFSWNVEPNRIEGAIKEYAQMARFSLRGDIQTEMNSCFERWEKEIKFDELIVALKKGAGTNSWSTLRLFEILVEKGHGVDAAILAAQEWMKSSPENAFRLFKILVEKGHGVDAAILAAQEWMKSIPGNALYLFKILVEKGHGFDAAILAAQEIMKSSPWNALQLFEVLVEKGHGFDAAILAAQEGMSGSPSEALGLFKVLVEKDHGVDAAILAAQEGMSGSPSEAIGLFKVLVEKGHGVDATILAAQERMKSSPSEALGLFKFLVANGHGVDAAILAAQERMKIRPSEALELFEVLVEKGHGVDATILAAQERMKSNPDQALRLFKVLVEKGHGVDAAILAAQEGMSSSPLEALELLEGIAKL